MFSTIISFIIGFVFAVFFLFIGTALILIPSNKEKELDDFIKKIYCILGVLCFAIAVGMFVLMFLTYGLRMDL